MAEFTCPWLSGPGRRSHAPQGAETSELPAPMDCLVTGGAGFIGSNLVDALAEPW